MKAEGMPGENPGCGGALLRFTALTVVLVLLGLCYGLAIQNTAAGHGPYPNPTLTPPAWTEGP